MTINKMKFEIAMAERSSDKDGNFKEGRSK